MNCPNCNGYLGRDWDGDLVCLLCARHYRLDAALPIDFNRTSRGALPDWKSEKFCACGSALRANNSTGQCSSCLPARKRTKGSPVAAPSTGTHEVTVMAPASV